MSDSQHKPNLVYILADDMGYGDVSCLNPESKIHSRNLDAMAAEGMIFRDAHASSAVCTPSRYSILTGRYNWRSVLKQGVTFGYSQPIIESNRLTVASYLKSQGYHTACFGKWHLGWEWAKQGDTADEVDYSQVDHPDYQADRTAWAFDVSTSSLCTSEVALRRLPHAGHGG
jgi:arylsulfatase A-like enzyme